MAASMEAPGALPGMKMPKPGKLLAHNASIADLASELQRNVLDRPVVDESGVGGRWDFELNWEVAPNHPSAQMAADGLSVELANAMKQQLGLRLDTAREAPAGVVVDQAHLPPGIE